MAENKDPAFLFYSSDFLVGVSDMTMEERGQYITLLCLQHTKGHLTKKNILVAVGQVSDDVLAKFTIDDNGCYYNARLEKEVNKRKAYSESRKKNVENRWNKIHMNTETDTYENTYVQKNDTYGDTYGIHTENVNVNKDINLIDNNTNNKLTKHTYGEFNNVLLTDSEYEKVKELPCYEKLIDALSMYIASKGNKYKSHYHTLLSWSRRNNVGKEFDTFDAEEMFQAALKRSYRDMDEE